MGKKKTPSLQYTGLLCADWYKMLHSKQNKHNTTHISKIPQLFPLRKLLELIKPLLEIGDHLRLVWDVARELQLVRIPGNWVHVPITSGTLPTLWGFLFPTTDSDVTSQAILKSPWLSEAAWGWGDSRSCSKEVGVDKITLQVQQDSCLWYNVMALICNTTQRCLQFLLFQFSSDCKVIVNRTPILPLWDSKNVDLSKFGWMFIVLCIALYLLLVNIAAYTCIWTDGLCNRV